MTGEGRGGGVSLKKGRLFKKSGKRQKPWTRCSSVSNANSDKIERGKSPRLLDSSLHQEREGKRGGSGAEQFQEERKKEGFS